MKKIVGNVIRELRKRSGLSQDKLIERIDLSKVYLSEIETGKKLPSLEVLRKLAQALNTSMTEIVAEVEKRLQ